MLFVLIGCSPSGASAHQRPVAEVLAQGSSELAQFTFDHPRSLFSEVIARSAKGSPEWQQATFGLAVCLQNNSPVVAEAITEASRLYSELIATSPESTFAPRATLNLGRIAELVDYFKDPVDLEAARARYSEVMTRWPDQDIASEAALRLASAYAQEDTTEANTKAIATLETWLAQHPKDPLASGMYQWLGDTYYMRAADAKQAVRCYIAADDLGLLWRGREGIVYWRIAQIAERKLKDRDLAVRYYTKLCEKAQTSGKAFEAQLALSRLGAPVPELTAFAAYKGPRPPLIDPPPPHQSQAEVGK